MAIKESFEWKPIDILICCAGIASSGRMGEAKVDVLEMINRVNLMGCVLPVHTALPMMKSRSLTNPSSIVIISSLASLVSYISNAIFLKCLPYYYNSSPLIPSFLLMPNVLHMGILRC